MHDTLMAEAAGELEWDDDESDSSVEEDEFVLVTDGLWTAPSRGSDLESGGGSLPPLSRATSRASRRLTSESCEYFSHYLYSNIHKC